jgi:hypothetical protein
VSLLTRIQNSTSDLTSFMIEIRLTFKLDTNKTLVKINLFICSSHDKFTIKMSRSDTTNRYLKLILIKELDFL